MKKYDVALALAKTGNDSKLALARTLIDMMDLNELYERLDYGGMFGELKELNDEECFDLLGIDPNERAERLEDIDADDLKNYDVVLALATAGNIEEARQVMELINPKKQLDVSDLKPIEELSEIIEEVVDKIIGAKEKLERKKLREKLKSVLWENIEK
ncbi:MAG: hypothetical protein U9N41_06965 [Euryarchaeota archaeon]|nr:hypothetical protein [Euryarchaeota archaeon]